MDKIKELVENRNYIEALLEPKLERSLANFLNKYESIMTGHHVHNISELIALTEQACLEGNDLIIQPEYCGYLVMVWRNR